MRQPGIQYRETRHLTRQQLALPHRHARRRRADGAAAGVEFWKYDEHVMHDTRILYFDERGNLVEPAKRPGMRPH